MGVEGRRLVDLGDADAQQLGKRHQFARAQATAAVLKPVQVFDQQIATQWQIAQKRGDGAPRGGVNAPPPPLPASLASSC